MIGQSKDWRTPLFELLRTRSVQFGEFVLASGASSDVYIDVRQTSLASDGAFFIGNMIWEHIRDELENIDAVGGLTLGADPLVTATSFAAHLDGAKLPGILIRKEAKSHGMQRQIEMPKDLVPGQNVVVVDDVITTAGSTLKAVHALREAGFLVTRAICIVDRESGGAQNLATEGIVLHPLFKLSDFKK